MGKFSKYNLPLKSMPKGTHEYEYHLDKQFFEDMDSSDVRNADLDVRLVVRYDGIAYDLSFAITGEITLLCDRCLDEMQMPVDTNYHIVVKYGDDYRDDSDELLEIPERDANLNVSYMIYDTVVLTIPIKHVHPVGKCNRAMSALLKKHQRPATSDEDAELEETLIEEMDSMSEPDSDNRD